MSDAGVACTNPDAVGYDVIRGYLRDMDARVCRGDYDKPGERTGACGPDGRLWERENRKLSESGRMFAE